MALNPELKEMFMNLANDYSNNLKHPALKSSNTYEENLELDETTKIHAVNYSLNFDDFTINIVYNSGEGKLEYEQNVLDSYIKFNNKHTELLFSFYDILRFIDNKNFKCYTFYYVNDTEKLKNAFKYLADSLVSYIDRIINLCSDTNITNILSKDKCYELQGFFGPIIFHSNEISNLPKYSRQFYYFTRFSKFNDKAYNCYLDGNYKKALALFKKKIKLNEYEFLFLNHLRSLANMQSYKTGDSTYDAIPKNLRFKGEVIKVKSKKSYAYNFLFPLVLLVTTIVYFLFFKFIEYLEYRGAHFLLEDKLVVAISVLIPASLTTTTIFVYIKQLLIVNDNSIPVDLRKRISSVMNKPEVKRHKIRSIASIIIVSIISITLGANNAIAFYDIGIKDSTQDFLLDSDFYLYSEIECAYVVKYERANFLSSEKVNNEHIVLCLPKDKKINLAEFGSYHNDDVIEELKEHNVSIKYVDNDSDVKKDE